MPEEEKTELESKGKLVREIYVDREVVDKFWLEDSTPYYGKPEKGMLGTLIFNDCGDERVILLMGSDCGTEDLMESEAFSEGSDGISFDCEVLTTRTTVPKEKLNGGNFDAWLHTAKNQQEENKFSEGVNKEAEDKQLTKTEAASSVGESRGRKVSEDSKLQIVEAENMISVGREEVQDVVNGIHHQCSGSLPYSGSISLRSTSSTASTHSFAFPILAQEWSSSPVRMAKPDRRQLRKQKSWTSKLGCFCSRF